MGQILSEPQPQPVATSLTATLNHLIEIIPKDAMMTYARENPTAAAGIGLAVAFFLYMIIYWLILMCLAAFVFYMFVRFRNPEVVQQLQQETQERRRASTVNSHGDHNFLNFVGGGDKDTKLVEE